MRCQNNSYYFFFVSERHDLLCSDYKKSNGHLFTCEDNILFLYVCEDIMFALDRSPGVSSVFI